MSVHPVARPPADRSVSAALSLRAAMIPCGCVLNPAQIDIVVSQPGSDQMDGMVGQHRDEQVRADTGVRAMGSRAERNGEGP